MYTPFVPKTDFYLVNNTLPLSCNDRLLPQQQRFCRRCKRQTSRAACLSTIADSWYDGSGARVGRRGPGAGMHTAQGMHAWPAALLAPKHFTSCTACCSPADLESCTWNGRNSAGERTREFNFTLGSGRPSKGSVGTHGVGRLRTHCLPSFIMLEDEWHLPCLPAPLPAAGINNPNMFSDRVDARVCAITHEYRVASPQYSMAYFSAMSNGEVDELGRRDGAWLPGGWQPDASCIVKPPATRCNFTLHHSFMLQWTVSMRDIWTEVGPAPFAAPRANPVAAAACSAPACRAGHPCRAPVPGLAQQLHSMGAAAGAGLLCAQDKGIIRQLDTPGNEQCLNNKERRCVAANPPFRYSVRLTGEVADSCAPRVRLAGCSLLGWRGGAAARQRSAASCWAVARASQARRQACQGGRVCCPPPGAAL